MDDHALSHGDLFVSGEKKATYVNTALGHESQIDYVLFSDVLDIKTFTVIDPSINFSDHLPLLACFSCPTQLTHSRASLRSHSHKSPTQLQLRWDKADLNAYYQNTGVRLQPTLDKLNSIVTRFENKQITDDDIGSCIDHIYDEIVSAIEGTLKTGD